MAINRYGGKASASEWSLVTPSFSDRYPNVDLKLAMNDGTQSGAPKQAWSDFDRFYSVNVAEDLPSGRHYIFICRPDLYLVEEGSAVNSAVTLADKSRVNRDPYFNYLAEFHPEIIASLTGDFAGMGALISAKDKVAAASESGYGNSSSLSKSTVVGWDKKSRQLTLHAFIPYLTSRVESLQLPDYSITQNAVVQPYTKYTVPYTTSAIDSSTGRSFDLNFREDRYFSIHKLFYAWLYYQNNVMRNIFSPKDKYLMHNALDYATSVYDFIVDDTGENIVYWAKYTGCVPTSVPLSDLSFNRLSGAETKISIPFSYFYCEHMDQNILMDFQYNSLGYIAMNTYFSKKKMNPFPINQTVPIYDADTFLGKNFVGRPVVYYCHDEKRGNIFKLRWLPA